MNADAQNNDIKEELSDLSYHAYEKAVSDERTPELRRERKIIRDSQIARQNLSPERVSELIEEGGVVMLHRSFRDQIPLFIVLLVSIVFTVLMTVTFPEATPTVPVQFFAPLVIVALLFHRRWNAKYFIESDGVTLVRGFLLINLSRLKCEYEKIKVIEVNKNILQRFLNVGSIRISTALVDKPELTLEGVSNPYFYTSLMKFRLKTETTDTEENTHHHKDVINKLMQNSVDGGGEDA